MTRLTPHTIATSFTLGAALLLSSGCSNAGEGFFSGAGIGAITGLIIGSTVGSAGEGAAIGAAIGGATGAVIGDQNERDAQYHQDTQGSMYNTTPSREYHDYGYGNRSSTTIYRERVYRESYAPVFEYRRSYSRRCR